MISKEMKDWLVLIVDDELDNLNVARKVLSFGGAKVHVARDGIEGLSVLQTVVPTFILLDLSMPNMDGWQMLEAVRHETSLNSVPIIALTAHAMAGDREKALDAGFNGYISKPFRIDSFLEEIHRCLDEFCD
ncbi:response regulator [Phototrophicus methaneseepsis]|uniref:Response regulator n=1 Tax=Phototrophicus methaneseepsis TaxID=2710758 RepID=A0A7S8E6S8_9CHLR|nr:response regulator [Phototrophicus methaneseepsis]QPC81415.1 response regulator [Phototrophicus methaneseepsis]